MYLVLKRIPHIIIKGIEILRGMRPDVKVIYSQKFSHSQNRVLLLALPGSGFCCKKWGLPAATLSIKSSIISSSWHDVGFLEEPEAMWGDEYHNVTIANHQPRHNDVHWVFGFHSYRTSHGDSASQQLFCEFIIWSW